MKGKGRREKSVTCPSVEEEERIRVDDYYGHVIRLSVSTCAYAVFVLSDVYTLGRGPRRKGVTINQSTVLFPTSSALTFLRMSSVLFFALSPGAPPAAAVRTRILDIGGVVASFLASFIRDVYAEHPSFLAHSLLPMRKGRSESRGVAGLQLQFPSSCLKSFSD